MSCSSSKKKINISDWHYLDWDREKVSKFWDFIEQSEAHKNNYFTQYYNREIIKLIDYITPLEGKILDYGCGIGYLSKHLLEKDISCEGCDFSAKSVAFVNQKFGDNSLWNGAKLIKSSSLPYEDNSFDFIFCVETIEHILDRDLNNTLNELHRILKPNTGKLFITTPNNEDLELGSTYCPDCGAVFHTYQHLRKFTRATLDSLMKSQGFITEICNVTDFDLLSEHPYVTSALESRVQQWLWIRDLLWKVGNLKADIIDFFKPHKTKLESYKFRRLIGGGRHLFWVGIK